MSIQLNEEIIEEVLKESYPAYFDQKAVDIIRQLQDIKGTGSAKAKANLLESVKDDPEFDKFFQVLLTKVLDPRIVLLQADVDPGLIRGLGLKSIKKRKLLDAINTAIFEAKRGDNGAKSLAKLYHSVLPEVRDVFKLFVLRELKAGFGIKSINKIWNGLIYYSPYMRCGSIAKKVYDKWDWTLGVLSQLKSDGMFMNLHISITRGDDDKLPVLEMQWVSRQGRESKCQQLANIASQMAGAITFEKDITMDWFGSVKETFHGELLVFDENGKMLEREAGNGLLNSVVEEGSSLPAGYTVEYRVWDRMASKEFFSMSGKVKYIDRWNSVTGLYNKYLESHEPETPKMLFSPCECRIVYSPEEMFAHFKELLERGEEGSVVKNPEGKYKDGTSNDQLKVKLIMDVDLIVVGYNDGDANGKHAGTLGSIQFESSDGRIVSGVAGISDDFRAKVDENREYYTGKIFTIRCNGIQYNPDPDKPDSLYFPRVVSEPRLDKTEADSFEEILQQQKDVIASGGKI